MKGVKGLGSGVTMECLGDVGWFAGEGLPRITFVSVRRRMLLLKSA